MISLRNWFNDSARSWSMGISVPFCLSSSGLSFMSMKSNPKTPDEYNTFENALKTVLSVSRSELQRREKEYQDRRKKEKSPKASGVSRASRGKG